MKNLFVMFCLFATTSVQATTLTAIPSPMVQGGMIHLDLVFTDAAEGTFSSSLEAGGPPQLQPLSLWKPGDDFSPAAPWYSALDPSQEARSFSSRWGFRVDTSLSDLLPAGTSIGVRMTSRTPGLETYFYLAAGAGTFAPVFLTSTSHDFVLWDGTMWHPVFTMPAGTPSSLAVTAEFEFFLANVAASWVDYTTIAAGAVPGYSLGTQTISWVVIPEPSTFWLVLPAAIWLWQRRRA